MPQTTLALKHIVIDPAVQCRTDTNGELVDDLYDAIVAGRPIPSPDVFLVDGKRYVLVDGHHRILACKKAGVMQITCNCQNGTIRDAILYSVSCNGSHGLRRTRADKLKSVRKLLDDPEWSSESDSWIAKQCNVSHTFVASVRQSAPSAQPTTTPKSRPDLRCMRCVRVYGANGGSRPGCEACRAKRKPSHREVGDEPPKQCRRHIIPGTTFDKANFNKLLSQAISELDKFCRELGLLDSKGFPDCQEHRGICRKLDECQTDLERWYKSTRKERENGEAQETGVPAGDGAAQHPGT